MNARLQKIADNLEAQFPFFNLSDDEFTEIAVGFDGVRYFVAAMLCEIDPEFGEVKTVDLDILAGGSCGSVITLTLHEAIDLARELGARLEVGVEDLRGAEYAGHSSYINRAVVASIPRGERICRPMVRRTLAG